MENENPECPNCGAPKEIVGSPQMGEIMTCGCCGSLVEVVAIAPLKLDKAPTIEEDIGE